MAKISPQFVIGGIQLTVDDYAADTFKISSGHRWPKQERIAHETALQSVGPDVKGLSLSGTAHHQYGGSMFQLDQLEAKMDEGKPVIVTHGTGKVFGKYCIVSIDNDHGKLMDDGRSLENKWSIKLEKYGKD
jgi:phage protein U